MRELNKILDDNEKVLWEGVPEFKPFFWQSSMFLGLFGLMWMGILIPGVIASRGILLLMPHFWIGLVLLVGVPVYNYLSYKYICYAITDKRVIFQTGLIGRDFSTVDFDQITNAEVNVGVFDKLFNLDTGSILVSTAGSFTYTKNGARPRPFTLANINNPYEIFKFFKKVSHDVKTDINYPNKLRPGENPGYKTDYTPPSLKN
jgi:membrane protein YdbS with pleckstrin-like domain